MDAQSDLNRPEMVKHDFVQEHSIVEVVALRRCVGWMYVVLPPGEVVVLLKMRHYDQIGGDYDAFGRGRIRVSTLIALFEERCRH